MRGVRRIGASVASVGRQVVSLRRARELVDVCDRRERSLGALDVLQAGGVAASATYDAVLPPTAKSAVDEEPPAPSLVQKWRKMDREWPCWSLAFAVPSAEALRLLAQTPAAVCQGTRRTPGSSLQTQLPRARVPELHGPGGGRDLQGHARAAPHLRTRGVHQRSMGV